MLLSSLQRKNLFFIYNSQDNFPKLLPLFFLGLMFLILLGPGRGGGVHMGKLKAFGQNIFFHFDFVSFCSPKNQRCNSQFESCDMLFGGLEYCLCSSFIHDATLVQFV